MRNSNLSTLIKISLLSVIAFIIMYIEVAIPVFPSFLKIDFSDLPALIATFSLGPVAGVLVELLKNILHGIFKGGTAFIGEFANFVVGGSLVFVAGLIHKRSKTFINALISLVAGTVVMSIVACVFNYFVLLPLYEKVLNFPISAIIGMSAAVNGSINSLFTLVLYAILPFNLLKGLIVSVITLAVYKKIVPILNKQQNDTYAA